MRSQGDESSVCICAVILNNLLVAALTILSLFHVVVGFSKHILYSFG